MDEQPHKGSILQEAKTRGAVRIATINAPTTYYEGRAGFAGFEYDLATAYAEHLGLRAEFVVYPTLEALFLAIKRDEADLAAAGLSVTAARQHKWRFGPPYLPTRAILVCHRGIRKIEDISDLGQIQFQVAAGSSFVDVLHALRQQNPDTAQPQIIQTSVEHLLEAVAARKIGCTIADQYVFALHRRYLPELEQRLSVGARAPLGWALGGGHTWRNISLSRDLSHWWATEQAGPYRAQLKSRYFAVSDSKFDYVDLARLRRAIKHKLPKYQATFEAAGARYDVSWTVLAAIAWRESHWRANAKSPTGVRGLMMLTQITAREQGVTNRLAPDQSIQGGARYLRSLLLRLPSTIAEDQRLAFALAAYNMGWGHMMDARALAMRNGANPDQWAEVAAVLPQLEQRAVYQTLDRGYARGREGQAYVAAVLNFADILEKAHIP